MADVDAVISSLHVGGEKFQLVDQGSIDKYLGLMIHDIDANTFEMSQPFLIRRILEFYRWTKPKQKGATPRLEMNYSIATLMEYLASILGCIVVVLAC